jgi:[ribosomal protein S5]-alanine N-acetyltransferase
VHLRGSLPHDSNHGPLEFRAFTRDDHSFFTALATDQRVVRFIGDGQPWARETIDERVEEVLQGGPESAGCPVRWFVVQRESQRVGLWVSTRRDDDVEIGYWVAPEFWG